MKHFLFNILFFLPTYVTFAQNPAIDSLKNAVKLLKEDRSKSKVLSTLSFELINIGSYNEALLYVAEEEKICKTLHYKKGLSDVKALYGTIWFEKGNYPEALKCYYESLKISEQINDTITIADALENIALVYYAEGNYNDALQQHIKALLQYKAIDMKSGIASTLINIGAMFAEQKLFDKALTNYFEALSIRKKEVEKHEYLILLSNIGSLYGDMNNYKEALKYLDEARREAQSINDKNALINIYDNLGRMSSMANQPDKAIGFYKKELAISSDIGSLSFIKNAFEGLSNANSRLGNYQQALNQYKDYIRYRDSLFNKENTKKLLQTQMQYEFDKKETASKVRQRIKDALANNELQKQKILKTAIAVAALLIIIVMILLFNRRKSIHTLHINRLENKTLRSQLNPHFIFNALASIQNYMNDHPDLAQNYLAKFARLMREVLENSGKDFISFADELDMLKKYMDLETLRVKHGFEYEIIIEDHTDPESVQVPPLIFQPVLENAIWHGVANSQSKGKISLHAVVEDEILKIEIENRSDDPLPLASQTYKENEKKKSFGLQIVRDRLILLSKEKGRKGTLVLIPIKNGMKVMMEIPV